MVKYIFTTIICRRISMVSIDTHINISKTVWLQYSAVYKVLQNQTKSVLYTFTDKSTMPDNESITYIFDYITP